MSSSIQLISFTTNLSYFIHTQNLNDRINLIFAGFDEYYARLKPTLDRKHCTEFGVNIPYGESNKFRLNCRNIWFNEYWSQHHRCSLNRNDENACTGNETMGPYEQEGLVPFVGEYICVVGSSWCFVNYKLKLYLNAN